MVQPITERSKSLGVVKAPESIQALAGQLENEHDVRMFHRKAEEELIQELSEFDPRVVGISTMTQNFPEGRLIAEGIKAIKENIIIVLGGWHATGCEKAYLGNQEEESLKGILNPNSPFDYIMTGESDLAFAEMMRRLEEGEDFKDLSGLGFLDGDKIRLNTVERIRDLDILADPSWNGLTVSDYIDKRSKKVDLSVHLQRGCRYNCHFCSSKTVCGKGVRRFSPERSVDRIENIIERFNPPTITCTDEDFFSNLEWVERLVRLLEERCIHKKWGTSFDTFASMNDLVKLKRGGRADLLKKMAEVGFGSFTIGIEALSAKTLRDFNKEPMIIELMDEEQRKEYRKSSVEEQNRILEEAHMRNAQEAVNFAQENGILVCGDFIVGNQGESEEAVRANFAKFSEIKNLFIAYIPTFTPFPGTELWKRAYDSGKLIRDDEGNIDWRRYNSSKGVLDVGYSINDLRNEMEVSFYTSERYRRDMLEALKSRPELIGLFRNRFGYVKEEFGENEIVEARLEELGVFSEKA